jgi:hypothetical protein
MCYLFRGRVRHHRSSSASSRDGLSTESTLPRASVILNGCFRPACMVDEGSRGAQRALIKNNDEASDLDA